MNRENKPMNKFTTLMAVASLAMTLPVSTAHSSPPALSPEAAVMVCDTSGNDPILVMNYSGSVGAPTISIGTSCAAAIATLLDNGFALHTAQQGDLRGGFYVFIQDTPPGH